MDGARDFSLKHDPEGWACNMGWAVVAHDGETLYRGPEWAARQRADLPYQKWPENAAWLERAESFGAMLADLGDFADHHLTADGCACGAPACPGVA